MVASVIGKIARKMVKSRNTKGKRTDIARERAERNLNKKRAETKVTKATKPPKRKPIPPKGPKPEKPIPPRKIPIPPTPPINKGGVKKLLKKYGVPATLIAGLLATRDTKKSEAKKSSKARKKGPSGPSMTSMRAPSTGPKPRNKNVTKRPKGPSKQGSFGR
jgi:hypothetical protein